MWDTPPCDRGWAGTPSRLVILLLDIAADGGSGELSLPAEGSAPPADGRFGEAHPSALATKR
jgi:hypothetical protein